MNRIILSGQRFGKMHEFMIQVGKLLPEKFIVIAQRQDHCRDFARVMERSQNDLIVVTDRRDLDRTRGLKDPWVVLLGDTDKISRIDEMMHFLNAHGVLTYLTIPDWR